MIRSEDIVRRGVGLGLVHLCQMITQVSYGQFIGDGSELKNETHNLIDHYNQLVVLHDSNNELSINEQRASKPQFTTINGSGILSGGDA